jgi:hypothetical protein
MRGTSHEKEVSDVSLRSRNPLKRILQDAVAWLADGEPVALAPGPVHRARSVVRQ